MNDMQSSERIQTANVDAQESPNPEQVALSSIDPILGTNGQMSVSMGAANAEAASKESACILIQRRAREMLAERLAQRQSYSCGKIQRTFRGFMARKLALCLRVERHEALKRHRHNQVAKTIQRYFRGHCTRTNVLDFAEWKRSVLHAMEASNAVRRQSEIYAAEMEAARKLATVQAACARAMRVYRSKHHLISTKSIPGVFNSPMWLEPVTVEGIPLENLVRRASVPTNIPKGLHLSPRAIQERRSVMTQMKMGHSTSVLSAHLPPSVAM